MKILGATVSPYTIYWQVHGEKEQKRTGSRKQQFRTGALDIAAGTISGNLVAYAIIVCTVATLFTHRQTVSTAARALTPPVGSTHQSGAHPQAAMRWRVLGSDPASSTRALR